MTEPTALRDGHEVTKARSQNSQEFFVVFVSS